MEQGKLKLINGCMEMRVSSHSLYADDVVFFCKGKLSTIDTILGMFYNYANIPGQKSNPSKSFFYVGSISTTKINLMAQKLGFAISDSTFTCLRVPIFRGKPKNKHLKPIVYSIKNKISTWEASLISISGRV